MIEVEAFRSELEKKVLKIEEKEDNHVTYLEAQLEGLYLAGDLDTRRGEPRPEIEKQYGNIHYPISLL